MKVALIGRTRDLITTGRMLLERGHEISLVATARSEAYYNVTEREFEDFADTTGATYIFGTKINKPETVKILEASGAKVAVSINWPIILGANVCAAFPHGVINAHAGDLPRFRGNACPNWAILRGESVIGLCLHKMEADRLDSGPVLLRDHYKLTPDTYIADIYEWMSGRIPEMFCALVDGLEDGSIKPVPQSQLPSDWLRCYPRRADDARIDWKQDASAVHRLIRASSRPLDGAFSFLEGQHTITIWRADLFEHPGDFLAVPGQILMRESDQPIVACGSGALLLKEFSLESPEAISTLRSLRSRLI